MYKTRATNEMTGHSFAHFSVYFVAATVKSASASLMSVPPGPAYASDALWDVRARERAAFCVHDHDDFSGLLMAYLNGAHDF